MRRLLKNTLICFFSLCALTRAQAGVIPLADQYQLQFDDSQWEYVLSDEMFKKSLGLLEAKSNQNIRGMIDTEVRFQSSKSSLSALEFLKMECQKLKTYWGNQDYEVKVERDRFCLVEQKPSKDKKIVTQVIEARQSRSTPQMFFVHSWTFHTEKDHLDQLREMLKKMREMQP